MPETAWQKVMNRLEAVRGARKMTQAAFAAAAGVSESHYSNWKTGRGGTKGGPSRPGVHHLAAIAQAHRITMDFLVLGEPEAIRPYSYRDEIVARLEASDRRNMPSRRRS